MRFSGNLAASNQYIVIIKRINSRKTLLIFALFVMANISNAAKNIDSDGDGLTDIEETRVYKTDPQLADTDTDGLSDGLEVNKYWTLPLVADTDGDGYLDGVEVHLHTDPLEASSHPDIDSPSAEDLDGDGLTNSEEEELGTDPQRIDSDFDGLSDGAEIEVYFTDPTRADTDGDGVWDGDEVNKGTDPGNPDDLGKAVSKLTSGQK